MLGTIEDLTSLVHCIGFLIVVSLKDRTQVDLLMALR
jgi:hypothetical protein